VPWEKVEERKKGQGYFGPLKRPDGYISTELSMGTTDITGNEMQIPLLVPTLTQDEINYLLSGKKPTEEIYYKAIEHAKTRIAKGLSPFAQEGEQVSKKKGWEVVEPPKIQLPQPTTLPVQQVAQSTFPQSQKDIGLFTGFEKIPGWFAAGGLGKKTLATLTKTPGTEWARYQEPKGIGEKIAAGLTELVGFFGLPIGLGKLATKPLIKFFGSYLIKQPFLARLVRYGIRNAATLGTAEAIRDIVDIKGTPKRIADGMITGTIFSIAGLSHITKYPVLNQILSQGGGRALEVLLKRYPKEYFTKENLPDLVFNEALKSVFYAQGTNLKTILANMEDIPQEKGRIKLSSNPDELARLNQRLQEMLIVSARKPEQVKTWVEKKWRKKPETKPPEVLPPELQPTEISPMPEEIKIKSPIRKEEKFWTKEETEKYLK